MKFKILVQAENYIDIFKIRLNKYILHTFVEKTLPEISSGEILQLCRKIESLGYDETARRVKVLRYQRRVISNLGRKKTPSHIKTRGKFFCNIFRHSGLIFNS